MHNHAVSKHANWHHFSMSNFSDSHPICINAISKREVMDHVIKNVHICNNLLVIFFTLYQLKRKTLRMKCKYRYISTDKIYFANAYLCIFLLCKYIYKSFYSELSKRRLNLDALAV